MSIEYLKNEAIAKLVNEGTQYQKSALTAFRLPSENEVGTTLTTFVNHEGQVRKESATPISADVVIARNLNPIGKNADDTDIFNEWPIPKATAVKNYGQSVVDGLSHTQFSNHKKQAILKGVALTPEIMSALGVKGDTLEIKVSWSEEPMLAKLGDVITDGGYSVSSHDMKDYEKL